MLWENYGIVVGDSTFNRADVSKVVHDLLHDSFRLAGFLPPKGNLSRLSLDDRLQLLPEFLENQQIMNELLFEFQRLYNAGEIA